MRLFRTAGIDGSASHARRLRPLELAVSTPISMITSGARATAELARRLNALALDVGEHVGAARGIEHVVQKADRAAGVDASKRFGVSPEHEQGSRPRPSRDALPDICNLCLDAVGERMLSFDVPDACAELANRPR